jgi:hypothetical protein
MTPDEVLARLAAPLSLRRRVGYVVVGFAGLAGSALVGLLWATEPALPWRTRAAFAVLAAIGLGWAAFGAWAVTRRAPLYARDRVVAGWIGAAAWLLFAAGALAVAVPRHRAGPALLGLVFGLGGLAVVNLAVARRHRAALQRRLRELPGGGAAP